MCTKYHVAVILYKSSSDSRDYVPLYEECITLIKANNEVEAKEKVEELTNSRATTFKNQEGQEISWSLHKIIDINPMLEDTLGETTEVYARHFKDIDAYNAFETLSK
ncbi:MAG: DUF4288 domain-containing protein [Methylococcaceae bacterium]